MASCFLLITSVFILIAIISPIHTHDGHDIEIKDRKLYRVVPASTSHLDFLRKYQKSEPSLIFWNGIGQIGEPVDILASQSAVEELFHEAPPSLRNSLHLEYRDVEIDLHGEERSTAKLPASTNTVDSMPLVPSTPINGTSLYTGTYYKIGLNRFSNGLLKVTTDRENTAGQHRYIIIQKNIAKNPRYQVGGQQYNEVQWYFSPSNIDGWYTLRNRYMDSVSSNAFATWSREKAANDLTYSHVVIRRNAQLTGDVESNENYLWKPVPTTVPGKYRMVVKAFGNDFLTWTNQAHGDDANYLQVEVSDDLKYRTKYEEGNEWWDDTLFTFHPIEAEVEAKITQIELDTRSLIHDGLLPLLMKTDCDHEFGNEERNLTFINRGSVESLQKIKYKSKVKGDITLKLPENINQFSKLIIKGAKMTAPWSSGYIELGDNVTGTVAATVLRPNEFHWETEEDIKFSTSIIVPPWIQREIQICHQHIELSQSDDGIPTIAIVEVFCKTERPTANGNGGVTSKATAHCVKVDDLKPFGKLLGLQKTSLVYLVSGEIISGKFGFQGIAVPILPTSKEAL